LGELKNVTEFGIVFFQKFCHVILAIDVKPCSPRWAIAVWRRQNRLVAWTKFINNWVDLSIE